MTEGLSFVVQLFAPRQSELHLDPVAHEDNGRRNHGQALLLDLGGEAFDLTFVHQQPPRPTRLVTGVAAVLVLADVTAHEDGLTTRKMDMGVCEVDPPVPDGLDLGAAQLDPSHFVLEEVVEVASLAILGDHPAFFAHALTFAMASTTLGSNW